MRENNYVSNADYKNLCKYLKDNMEDFLDKMDEYETMVYEYDLF